MIYGYARVSTVGQKRDGNSLEEQTAALERYGCQEIVTEAYSGKTIARQNPDYREGRPKKYKEAQISHALSLLDDGHSYRQVERMTGISKSTLVRAKRARST